MSQINKNIFKSLWILFGYRKRVLEGIVHDVRQRYVGSAFGTLWVLLFPAAQLSIYAGMYTFIFKIRVSGLTTVDYIIMVFAGILPLMAFSEMLSAATSSLSSNKNLLVNTVFPAELIPLRAGISSHVPSLVGLVITLSAGLVFGRTSWVALVFIPVFWVLLLMFAMGIGWIFSLFSLVARDIQHGLGLITMLLFVLSPSGYTLEMVPQALRPLVYFNPLSYFVISFQQLICFGTLPSVVPALGAFTLGIGSFLLGFMVFQRAKAVFFDYV
jgi:lipopolysaccharide transport system permease protein